MVVWGVLEWFGVFLWTPTLPAAFDAGSMLPSAMLSMPIVY